MKASVVVNCRDRTSNALEEKKVRYFTDFAPIAQTFIGKSTNMANDLKVRNVEEK